MASHFRTVSIKDIRRETSDCISIAFEIPAEFGEEFQFKHGQNITVKTIIEGEEIRRSYSICSSPLENELRVAVKKVLNGKFSGYAGSLRKGSLLEILPPTGKFYTELNTANRKEYIAFAAGSGITPILSIIKTTLATEPQSSFTLVYGNRNRGSIIFKEQLEAIKNRYMDRFSIHHILSREKTDAPVNHGRINIEKCNELNEKLLNTKNADEIFICGPEEMIFAIKEWLEAQGIEKKKIHFELFTIPGEKPGDRRRGAGSGGQEGTAQKNIDAKTSSVTIKLDGIAFDFNLPYDGEPILDAALKQGADLPFSCKGGVCCTCKAKLIEGEVDMDVNWGLEQEEIEAGFILTCQSHPKTKRVVVNYDLR